MNDQSPSEFIFGYWKTGLCGLRTLPIQRQFGQGEWLRSHFIYLLIFLRLKKLPTDRVWRAGGEFQSDSPLSAGPGLNLTVLRS